jgi:acetyl-CoA C-acetyltransferase
MEIKEDSTNDVVLVAAARTPFGSFGGSLREFSLPKLGSLAVKESLRRIQLSPETIDELIFGVNLPGSDRSIGRQVLLHSGIPEDRVAYTVDRACCSSLTAISLAARSIRLGEAQIAVAGGAENMSRVPYFLEDMRWGHRLGNIRLIDQLVISCPYTGEPRAVQAGREALEFGIGRDEQDRWALQSHERYFSAAAAGKFRDEIFPVELPGSASGSEKSTPERDRSRRQLEQDESPRQDTSLEKLSNLPTVHGSPTVTAGNAPGLSSGASAVVLMSRDQARTLNLQPLATLVATRMASGEPYRITSIPAVAARKVLAQADLQLQDIALIEINEAFAAVPLTSTLLLADGDSQKAQEIRVRTNVNGGAIAIGHPTGATGARLIMTLAYELARRGGGYGLVSICGGIGEAEAAIIRV